MSAKTAVVSLAGDGLRLEVLTGSGHRLVLDDAAGDAGARPSELVPAAAAACAAMDVISILRKKRQDVRSYRIEATGQQADGEHPAVFTRLDVTHIVEGPALDPAAVRRAVELSATRHCAVGGTLSSGITEIHHHFVARDAMGHEERGEVLVTGPHGAVLPPSG